MTSLQTSYNVAPNSGDNVAGIVPIGAIMLWGTTKAPDGWLICDGGEFSRTEYAVLFSLIGTTYGSTTSTTFKVPNTQNVVIRGLGNLYTPLGVTGGADSYQLKSNDLPEHTHPITDPGHSHVIQTSTSLGGDAKARTGDAGDPGPEFLSNSDFTGITGTDVNTTDNDAIPTLDPFIVLAYIIRAY
jgi:microcystin-dependent protein